ncbi:hypothetical protein [Lactobacillus delbrueckii]
MKTIVSRGPTSFISCLTATDLTLPLTSRRKGQRRTVSRNTQGSRGNAC